MKRTLFVLIVGLILINVFFLIVLLFGRRPVPAVKTKERITLPCPVPRQYCAAFVPVYREGADKKRVFYGFGWQLPEGTAVYSLFPGAVYPVSATLYPRYGQPGLALEQLPGKHLHATYVFSGEAVLRYTPTDRTGEVLLATRKAPVADTVFTMVVRIHQVQDKKLKIVEPGQVVFTPL